jgi:hypothetical protein
MINFLSDCRYMVDKGKTSDTTEDVHLLVERGMKEQFKCKMRELEEVWSPFVVRSHVAKK